MSLLLLILAAFTAPSCPYSEADEAAAEIAEYEPFERPVRPKLPRTRQEDWVRTPVDAFVLARLEAEGLNPAPRADRITLLRRVTFDLTGLPPTADEVDAFLGDKRPDAYEKVVERLLANPHYGERWAQHWLDVARYADSNGFEYDDPRPNAWRFRDWVIRSLNEDRPYDEFVRLQVGGDELAPDSADALVATGFNRLGPLRLNAGNQDEEKNRQEFLVEMTDAIGSSFLALTIGCARCHDHKFDPISQADYFRLQAFFAATDHKDHSLGSESERAAHERDMKSWREEVDSLKERVKALKRTCRGRIAAKKATALPENVRAALALSEGERSDRQKALVSEAAESLKVSAEEIEQAYSASEQKVRASLRTKIGRMRESKPDPLPAAFAVMDRGAEAPATHILRRGEPGQHLDEVQPRFMEAVSWKGAPSIPAPKSTGIKGVDGQASTGRRAALARWLGSDKNPLTARVMVNRVWQHHFGRGLVATPNDFGMMGEYPSHPQLLDWLATEFVAGGWSVKALHRVIVNSATYRQSSHLRPDGVAADPDNELLWRMPRRRLDAETFRDSILALSGAINRKAQGPGVRAPLSKEVAALLYKGKWEPTPDPAEHQRRTIYLFVKRNLRVPFLETFDAPSTVISCGSRPVSTHAGQALALLNGPFLTEQSEALARRLLAADASSSRGSAGRIDIDAIIKRAYRLTLSRLPRDEELRAAKRFLTNQVASLRRQAESGERVEAPKGFPNGVDPLLATALTDFSLVVLNLDELMFVD